MRKKINDFLSVNSGATAIEYGLLVGLASIAIIVSLQIFEDDIGAFFENHPELADSALFIALIGIVLAGIGWLSKRALSSLDKQAKLYAVEILSDGEGKTQSELMSTIRRINKLYWAFPAVMMGSIETLYSENRLIVKNGRYYLSSYAPSKN